MERCHAFILLVQTWLRLSAPEDDLERDAFSFVNMMNQCILFSLQLWLQYRNNAVVQDSRVALIQTFLQSCFSPHALTDKLRCDLAHRLLQEKNTGLFESIHSVLLPRAQDVILAHDSSLSRAQSKSTQAELNEEAWLIDWFLLVLRHGNRRQGSVRLLLRYVASTEAFLQKSDSEQALGLGSQLASLFSISELFCLEDWKQIFTLVWPNHQKEKWMAGMALTRMLSSSFSVFQNRGFENQIESEKTVASLRVFLIE